MNKFDNFYKNFSQIMQHHMNFKYPIIMKSDSDGEISSYQDFFDPP